MKPRLVLVDDHPMFRDGLRAFLEREAQFEIAGAVGTIADAERLLEKRAGQRPVDYVLLDIALGEINSINEIPRLKAAAPHAEILMLSMYGTTTLVRAAFAAGARGFVSKTSAGPEIIAAVEALRRGRHYIDESLEIHVGQSLAVSGLTVATDRYARLSPREQQVFFLLAQGCRPRQIAQKLGIAKRTADAHRYHIIQKLEVESIAGLVRLAAELGVVDPSAPQ